MSRFLALLASAMLAVPAFAQTPGACDPGTAQAFLDVSDVQASLFNDGALFFGGSTTSGDGYLVPKFSGNSPLFAAALWIGGKVNGETRTSHSRYGNRQMWPGPLNADGTLPNPADCSAYDRIYVVSTYDVAIYEETGVASSDLADWPVGLGAPAVDAGGQPVVATSREQTLELANGERPVISGTQTAFWIMNDVGNEHTERNEARETIVVPPLGVEIAVTAFAIASEEAALNQGTFYQYTVTNRNTSPITDAYFGFYIDPDLGDAGDDYVGVDTTRGLAFVYNTYEDDSAYGIPPALGFDLLGGLGSFVRLLKSSTDPVREPTTADEVYHRLQALDNDGGVIREGGLGYEGFGGTGAITRFMFAGDPVTDAFWSEGNVDGNTTDASPGDRLMAFGSPEFSLKPGESKTFALALAFGQGTDRLDSITEMRAANDVIQMAYNEGTLFETVEAPPLLAAPVLLAPSEASTFIEQEPVLLSWASVPDAEVYRVEQSVSPSFEDPWIRFVDSTSVRGALSPNDTTTYYWRVRAESPTRRGTFSDVRSYTSYVYRYFRDVLRLQDGSPAFVEVVGPDGSDPCAEGVTSPDGCDEVDGNLVYNSLNSTGTYYVGAANGLADSQVNLQQFAPNDFEIRFTDTGGLGYYIFQEDEIIRVPFEIWDIGMVAPGDVNDPSDDVRLIPALFADNGGTCAFNADEIPDGQTTISGYVESDRIYAYYPTTTYDDFEAAFGPLVASAPESCYLASAESAESHIDLNRYRPIQRQVFGSSSATPTLPATGTVIRFYTTDPRPVSDEDTPRAGELTLGAPYPNPTASSLTVPYRLVRSSAVELAVYDVLGRRVLELVDTRQPEGAHTATLDARALAPGVYVIRLRAGEEVRTTRITVVR